MRSLYVRPERGPIRKSVRSTALSPVLLFLILGALLHGLIVATVAAFRVAAALANYLLTLYLDRRDGRA